MTVDRENRDRLADAVRRYLGGEIASFDFDDAIFAIRDASDDPTVQYVVGRLWFHYDDLIDHEAGLSKDEWDFFQRLLLVLASEAHVALKARRRWSGTQLVAAAALILLGAGVAKWGLDWRLASIALPSLAAVSIAIARRQPTDRATKSERILAPFSSFAELRAVRRKVVGFSKRRRPPQMQVRRIRSPAVELAIWVPTGLIWILFSPAVLVFQLLPHRKSYARVEVPAR